MTDFLERLTLYDFIGYFVPGLAFIYLAPLAVDKAAGLSVTGQDPWLTATIYFVAAYVVGHLLQGFARLVNPRTWIFNKDLGNRVNPTLLGKAKGLLDPNLSDEEVLLFVDSMEVPTPLREVYVARQGFYRGFALTFLLLAVCCLYGSISNSLSIWWFFGSLVLSAVCYKRYSDFVLYEVRGAIAWICREQAWPEDN